MYDAFPELPAIYDSVPLYAARRDPQFYIDEARDAGGSVLEIGCGTGRVLLPIARAGHTITGVDASPHMLARCQTKLRAEPGEVQGRVTLHQRDARSFDLERKFDLVIAPFRVMQHLTTIEDQLGFLGSAARHLAPGGRLAFDVFNPNFAILVSAGGMEEREDTPETTLADGRTFRRAGRVSRVRWIDQVSEIELVYYISGPSGEIERRVQSFDMRWFLRAELVNLLARAGFRIRTIYGDFDRSPLTDASREQVVCAEKVTTGAP